MENKSPLFLNTFKSLRDNPKWKINLLILILISIITSYIISQNTNFHTYFKDMSLSGSQLKQAQKFVTIGVYLNNILGILLTILCMFIVFLIISKIMESDVKKISLFSASILFNLINSSIVLVIVLIQWGVGLDLNNYNLTSLNIFDKGSKFLAIFDLKLLIKGYLFGIVMYSTCLLNKKISIIYAFSYIIVILVFSILFYYLTV